jgi:hypothetical protein
MSLYETSLILFFSDHNVHVTQYPWDIIIKIFVTQCPW